VYASASKLGATKNSLLKGNKAGTGSAKDSQNNTTKNNNSVVSGGNSKENTSSTPGKAEADYTVNKQVVSTIEVHEKYDRKDRSWKWDTISTGKTEMNVYTPAEKTLTSEPTVAAHPAPSAPVYKQPTITVKDEIVAANEIVPASAMSVNANDKLENDNLVPLSNFKVASKQSNYSSTNLIEQMIQNAKVNVGQAKFYGGVIGGLNTSLSGNNSMWGFQLGLSGLLSLNERWGIVSELKFMQRFNSKAVANNGFENLDSATVDNVTTYTWDSVNRSFNFPTVSAVELPLYIKYTLSRFNFHAGMNLTYNFAIKNVEENSFKIRQVNNEGPVMQGAVNYSFDNGVPKIELTDFSSRFSLGYLFGMGYQLSPALQLDVRMTKAFADNAKTNGAKELSKKIYNQPSVQVNLNYRFSSNKFKPYRKQ
jgi:hypothetical protein